jgi:aflatoxin B1 aldehyde reductase
MYHSALSGDYNDSVIIGCSTIQQLQDNLDAIDAGPLSNDLAQAMNNVWDVVKDHTAPYHL